MNPSTALARVLVDELVQGGVREAVLAPGSRSAPLALALHAADATGRLRLHVRVDERSAAFLALGLAKASGAPVPVVTTSGTAVANLHPAVLEASEAGVPLLVLSADRPPELRGTGANQTVDQVKVFGGAVRLFVEVGTPEGRVGEVGYWRSLASRALAVARGALGGPPGPVQLNLGLREPLVPDGDERWVEPLQGRDGAWTAVALPAAPRVPDDLPERTLVVLGDGAPATAGEYAAARGFPVLAEPSSGAAGLPCAEALLGTSWAREHAPERVLVAGRPTLSRAVVRLTAAVPTDVVAAVGGWSDPARRAVRVLPGVPAATGPRSSFGEAWHDAGTRARAAVQRALDAEPEPTEPGVAAAVAAAAAGGLLVVGSSKPVRDLALVGVPPGTRVLANRGAAGIDGTVSTALGAALAAGPGHALLGDLTLLHDAGGLVLGPHEPRPDLCLVVVDNDGGGIFSLLEQAGPDHAAAFERVFGTPHGVDLEALCAATRTPYRRAATRAELAAALAPAPGVRVVHVRTDRHRAAAFDRGLREAVAAAVG